MTTARARTLDHDLCDFLTSSDDHPAISLALLAFRDIHVLIPLFDRFL